MERLAWLSPGLRPEAIKATALKILGLELHPLAIDHLTDDAIIHQLPFPRLEKHEGYLFGTFFLPSNVENPSADFDSIVFVATHDAVLATSGAHPTSERDWETDRRHLFEIDTTDETPDGGQFILNSLRLVMRDLLADADTIHSFLRSRSSQIHGGVDLTKNLGELSEQRSLTSKERRAALKDVRDLVPAASGVAAEMPTMKRIAVETSLILESLAHNDEDRDLQVDLDGQTRELFARSLEIHLTDLLLDSRQLIAMLDEIDALVEGVFDRARRLAEEENLAAGRFTGAIASIMLLPTFIVGLYGQNFAQMPETDWAYGYLFSWGAIVVLTIFQVWFFRRRRWL